MGIAQIKRIYPLSRLGGSSGTSSVASGTPHGIRIEPGGMLSSGTLVVPFFQGATEVRFAPTFMDCGRLQAVLVDILEVLGDSKAGK